jgi:hypothetical protein
VPDDLDEGIDTDAMGDSPSGDAAPEGQPAGGSHPPEPKAADEPKRGATPIKLVSEATLEAEAGEETPKPEPKKDADQITPEIKERAQRYLKMYDGDLDRALAAALDQNNRLAELARQQKVKGPKETAAPPETTEPASPDADADAEPAVPFTSRDEAYEWGKAQARNDAACQKLADQYATVEAEYAKLYAKDPKTGAATGELVDLNQKLTRIQLALDPAGRTELNLPELDDFGREDLMRKQELLATKRERLMAQAQRLSGVMENIASQYEGRVWAFVQAEQQKLERAAQTREQKALEDQEVERTSKRWDATMASITKGLPEGTANTLQKYLVMKANLHVNVKKEPIDDIEAWAKGEAEEFLASFKTEQGRSDVAAARERKARVRPPAPKVTHAQLVVPERSTVTPAERIRAANSRTARLSARVKVVGQ